MDRKQNSAPQVVGADPSIKDLAKWIYDADKVLIVGAAGLSIHNTLPNNPYHSDRDFAQHYPLLSKEYGYRNGYHAMGLQGDVKVPPDVKVAFTAVHFLNMRFRFPPTDGYTHLLELAKTKSPENVFIWTSNADGCFERAGFDKDRVYTVQGEMNKLQCGKGCGHVWNCEAQLKAMDVAVKDGRLTDMSLVPTCPNCGGKYMVNLRGGDWFIHKPFEQTAIRLMKWLDDAVVSKAKVVVLEVGVGPNTPIVTKTPACMFAAAVAAAGGKISYLRINPDQPDPKEKPVGVENFHHLQSSWTVLESIVKEYRQLRAANSDSATEQKTGTKDAQEYKDQSKVDEKGPKNLKYFPHLAPLETHGQASRWQQQYHKILKSLWTPR